MHSHSPPNMPKMGGMFNIVLSRTLAGNIMCKCSDHVPTCESFFLLC